MNHELYSYWKPLTRAVGQTILPQNFHLLLKACSAQGPWWQQWVPLSIKFSLHSSPWRGPEIFKELAAPLLLPLTPSQDISSGGGGGWGRSSVEFKWTDTSGRQSWWNLSHLVLCRDSSSPESCIPQHLHPCRHKATSMQTAHFGKKAW